MKRTVCIILTLMLMLTLFACTPNREVPDVDVSGTTKPLDTPNTPATDNQDRQDFVTSGEKITVAALINTDGLAVWYADKMGYFEELGLDVDVVYFINGTLENEALAAGEADIGFNGFAGVYALATGDYSLIGDCDDGKGLAIYVQPDSPLLDAKGEFSAQFPEVYGNAELCAGRSFAATLGTIQQIMVDSYYEQLGVTDYNIVGMDVASCYNALIAKEVDGAALTMNFCSQAEEAGMVCLGTYEELTGVGQGANVLVLNDYLESNYSDVVLVLRAAYKAFDEIQNDEQLEYDEGMTFFKEQGSEYSDSDMRREIEKRDLYDYDFLENELELGLWQVYTAMKLVDLGLLEEGAPTVVAQSVRADVLEDAVGFPIKTALPEGYEND